MRIQIVEIVMSMSYDLQQCLSDFELPCFYRAPSNTLHHGTVLRRGDRNFFLVKCRPAYIVLLHPNMAAKV